MIELFNLLINPESHEFALRWHRDDVREKASEEEEVRALGLWHHGVRPSDSCHNYLSMLMLRDMHHTSWLQIQWNTSV